MAGGEIAGSGGWSDDLLIQPAMRPANANDGSNNDGSSAASPSAKIRAVFVNPKFARQGVGRAIVEHAEAHAHAAGFAAAEVLATLTGVRLCERGGYERLRPVRLPLADGTQLDFVHMRKLLAQRAGKPQLGRAA